MVSFLCEPIVEECWLEGPLWVELEVAFLALPSLVHGLNIVLVLTSS